MSDSMMEKINRFTRRELKEDEIYSFSVILCDNDIDRDCEKFSISALKRLAELYIGKTGIWSHDPKGENQTARIYDAEVVSDPTRKTADGETYTYLRASAYMVRTSSNADLIREIDGGIKKEVSVGCAVSKELCSVCGRDRRAGGCSHKKGRVYGGRKCFSILEAPTDAYEWSFVAVPAQKGAGVTKRFGGEYPVDKSLFDEGVLDELCEDLRRDIIRLSFLEGSGIPAVMTRAAVEKMVPRELIEMKKALIAEARDESVGELEKIFTTQNQNEPEANKSFRV